MDSDRGPPIDIYLDLRDWIYLSRAHHNRPDGAAYLDTFNLASKAVEEGVARFPLSSIHYIETLNTGDLGRRQRLSETMAVLSRFRTLLDPSVMRDQEIRAAIERRFGVDLGIPAFPLIGEGSDYAFQVGGYSGFTPQMKKMIASLPARYQPSFEAALKEHQRKQLSGEYRPSWRNAKETWLRGADFVIEALNRADKAFEKTSRKVRHDKLRIAEAHALLELAAPFLAAAGVRPEDVDDAWVEGLLDDVPSIYVVHQFQLAFLDDRNLPRERNNFADINHVSLAIVACDVVVTEKRWVDLATRADLHERFGVNYFRT